MVPETAFDAIGVILAGCLTLCVYSFLFRDNPLFKLTEAIFVGVSVGYGVAVVWHNGVIPKVITPLQDYVVNYATQTPFDHFKFAYLLVAIAIGSLYLSRFTPKNAWLSRYPMAYLIGIGAGLEIPLSIQTSIFPQMQSTLVPLVVMENGSIQWVSSIGHVVLVLGVLSVLYYFFFSFRKEDLVSRGMSTIGIGYLMIGFGASFALTVMARVSLLIGRVDFLKEEWILGTLRYFGAI